MKNQGPSSESRPEPGAPSGSRLLTSLLVVFGLLLGCGVAVGSLMWWDRQRRETEERQRQQSLAQLDERAGAEKARGDAAPARDHLSRFNEQFRDIYRMVRAESLARASPVVVVSGDDLILFQNGERRAVAVVPPLYHELKAYAHIPLAAYLVSGLEPGNSEIPASRQLELKKLLERLPELRDELATRGYGAGTRQRQELIINETAAFLEQCHQRAYDRKPIDAKEREAFARKLREPILANVRDAAREQITSLDKQMNQWHKELSDEEWNQLRVVVIGSAMPRDRNLSVQYFAWLLKDSSNDRLARRIVYAEGLFEEPKALNLLGTHIVDTEIGRDFFAEPTRMKRDLLGDAAEQILEEMTRQRASP